MYVVAKAGNLHAPKYDQNNVGVMNEHLFQQMFTAKASLWVLPSPIG